MGSIFCNAIMGIENPSIGLLNVGEEPSKGTAELIEAYNKLKSSELNFYGNVEGSDILTRKTDIVVADGYVGNVILKFAESMIVFFSEITTNYLLKNLEKKEQIPITVSFIKEILTGFSGEEAGGVPLLGVKGNVIVGHGSSTPKAIKNMIMAACTIIEEDICKKIEVGLSK